MCETAGNQLDMREVVFILMRTIADWRGTKSYRRKLRCMARWEALGTRCCGLVVEATGEKVYKVVNCKPGAISCQSSEELCGRSRELVLVASQECSRFGAECYRRLEAE